MEERYKETINTWNKVSKIYADRFMDLDLYDESYQQFCALLPEQPSVIELGCGPGNITQKLLQFHPTIKILATDVAPNMISMVKNLSPSVSTSVLDARNLSTIEDSYHGVMCGFVIPYLGKEDVITLMKDIKRILLPNGLLYLSFVPGAYNNSGYISGSTGARTYFYYYEESYIRETLSSHNIEVIFTHKIDYSPSPEHTEEHVILIAKSNHRNQK